MTQIASVVALGIPHHVTQQGNRRRQTFFNDEDCQTCWSQCPNGAQNIWCKFGAYCLMPNHVMFA
jgi:putative transposase